MNTELTAERWFQNVAAELYETADLLAMAVEQDRRAEALAVRPPRRRADVSASVRLRRRDSVFARRRAAEADADSQIAAALNGEDV